MEEEVTILVEQNEAPAFQVVVAAAILCKQDFSYANQVGGGYHALPAGFSITSQREEEAIIIGKKDVSPAG